jgi:hypothetical protein
VTAPRFGDVYLIETDGAAPDTRLIVSSDFHLTVQAEVVLTALCYPAELVPDVWRSTTVDLPATRGPQRVLLDRIFAIGRARLSERITSLDPQAASEARAALTKILLG